MSQPDLFGEFDAAVQQRDDAERAREAWAARFERRDFPAPYPSASYAEGDVVHGWVCPACDGVEWGAYQLALNHGYDPGLPDRYPRNWDDAVSFGDTCHRLDTRRRLAELDEREGTPGKRIPVGGAA